MKYVGGEQEQMTIMKSIQVKQERLGGEPLHDGFKGPGFRRTVALSLLNAVEMIIAAAGKIGDQRICLIAGVCPEAVSFCYHTE